MTQRHFIGGYFRYQPAQVGRFLGGHPAMLIQSDRFIRHDEHLGLEAHKGFTVGCITIAATLRQMATAMTMVNRAIHIYVAAHWLTEAGFVM
jgi:hypothetical protein